MVYGDTWYRYAEPWNETRCQDGFIPSELPARNARTNSRRRGQPQFLIQERQHIAGLGDQLRRRLTSAVTGTGFDADQRRSVARMSRLQGGGEFEAVGRHDAIIALARHYKRGGITCASLQVMQ